MSCSSFRRDSSRPVARTRTPRPKRRRTTSKEMLEVAPRMRHDFGEGESAYPPLEPMQRAPENGAIALKEEATRDLRRASIAGAAEFMMPQYIKTNDIKTRNCKSSRVTNTRDEASGAPSQRCCGGSHTFEQTVTNVEAGGVHKNKQKECSVFCC